MMRWMKVALAVIPNVGCQPIVLDAVGQRGQGSTTTTESSTVSSSSSGSTGDGAIDAIAILAKDVPGGSALWTDLEPDSLFLMWSNRPQACSDPVMGEVCPDPLDWQSMLIVPPDLVRPGLVDLGNSRVQSFAWSYFGPPLPGTSTCNGGGGGGDGLAPGGTLEIDASDASSITVKLNGGFAAVQSYTQNGITMPAVTLDGSFTIPRCDPAPATPPPNAAVAIRGADLPAGLPTSPTIGAMPDPTSIYVFLGTGTQTCADPLAPIGCSGAGRVVLQLPTSLQEPGTIDLTSPDLTASLEVGADVGGGNCTSNVDASPFMQGTMTIHGIDASGISFTLYEALAASPSGTQFDADGLYQATLCP